MRAYKIRELYASNKTLRQIQIQNRINPAIYKIIDSNRHIALIDERGKALNGIQQLVVDERVKIPLYKQAMQIQMGQKPKQYQQYQKIIHLRQLDVSEDRNYVYKVIVARR